MLFGTLFWASNLKKAFLSEDAIERKKKGSFHHMFSFPIVNLCCWSAACSVPEHFFKLFYVHPYANCLGKVKQSINICKEFPAENKP